ncbi:MAG: FHA domain-containing protein [Elainella sp. Prado103]|jgi:pSer/pThr/pTyr-binding forkhead associated (FHA) protein|nr:FHA domain-containing protein [Elainella sp. Prado103]
MANRNDLAAYTSSLVNMSEDTELQERLRLYQVFSKLYTHHRGLLDEILDLESSSAPVRVTLPYIQGFISDGQSYLVTNLMQGKTQALSQPQQIWTIGRDPRRSQIAVQDIRLSRCHAAVRYMEGQGFYLIDLESRNQSFVNGEPVRQTLLKEGDQVRLGSIVFTFFLCGSTCSLEPLPPETLERIAQCQQMTERLQDHRRDKLDIQETEIEEDNIPTLDLYHDTSKFLRSIAPD